MPSARFRTWPLNGEFFRQGCLAVGCRCFAATGAERMDVGAKQNQNETETVPKATDIDPKGCQQQPTWNPKVYQTKINRCRKTSREKVANTSSKTESAQVPRIILGTIFHTNHNKYNPEMHSKLNCEKHENSIKRIPAWSQNVLSLLVVSYPSPDLPRKLCTPGGGPE